MKNIYLLCTALLILLLVRKVFLPSNFNYSLYTGIEPGTRTVIAIPSVNYETSFPRFPGDVILAAPLKKVKYLDVVFLKKNEVLEPRKTYIQESIPESETLGYCYLRMVTGYGAELPVSFKNNDIFYDIHTYVKGDIESFDLTSLSLDSMSPSDKKGFLLTIGTQALHDIKKATINQVRLGDVNFILKMTSKENNSIRYLWCYKSDNTYLYVVDPMCPELSYTRVNKSSGVYNTADAVFRLDSIYQIFKDPVEQEAES